MDAATPIHERLEGASARISDDCASIETFLWAIGTALEGMWKAGPAGREMLQTRADKLVDFCTDAVKRISAEADAIEAEALAIQRAAEAASA